MFSTRPAKSSGMCSSCRKPAMQTSSTPAARQASRMRALNSSREAHARRSTVKAGTAGRQTAPTIPAARFSDAVLEEWKKAGLVEVSETGKGKRYVSVPEPAREFAARLRALDRYRLLRQGDLGDLSRYVGHCF